MRGIPERRIREAARRLRERWTAMDDALEALARARSDAASITGTLANTDGGGRGSRVSVRTARAAERVLTAEERVRRLEAWERVFAQVERDFPAQDLTGDILRRHLIHVRTGHGPAGPSATLRDIEREHELSHATVMRYKDMVLERVAYYAAEAGISADKEADP